MAEARSNFTATLLLDGRVLIAGGMWAQPSKTAELYDPKTGKFTRTGSMSTARDVPAAALLVDGRVLVAGGEGTDGRPLASAEIFDPTRGNFTSTGSMSTPRETAGIARLRDGTVLVLGGMDSDTNGGTASSTAEIYDPVSGAFHATGSMAESRGVLSASRLSDGRVLVAGGFADMSLGIARSSAEIYDPSTGRSSATGSMASLRSGASAVLLADGRVMVAGGQPAPYAEAALDSVELFDPTSGSFGLDPGPMTRARLNATATALADGSVAFALFYT